MCDSSCTHGVTARIPRFLALAARRLELVEWHCGRPRIRYSHKTRAPYEWAALFFVRYFSCFALAWQFVCFCRRVHSSSPRTDPPGKPPGEFRCGSRVAGKKKKERKNKLRSIIFFYLFDFILFTPLRIQTKRKKRSRIVIGQFLSLYTPPLRQVCPLLLSRSVSPSIYFLAVPFSLSERKNENCSVN